MDILDALFDASQWTPRGRRKTEQDVMVDALRGQQRYPPGPPPEPPPVDLTGTWGPMNRGPGLPDVTPGAPRTPQGGPGGSALPRAMGSQPQAPAAPPGPPQANPLGDLEAQQARLMQGPDRSGMEAAFKRNQQEGSQGLLLALAAQEAGNQPIGAHYLKRAAEAGQPMKTAGGTMTANGFIPDADYANNQQLALVNQKIAREQHIIDAATSEKSKMAAEERRRQFEMEKLRISEGGAWGRANLAAGTAAAKSAAAGGHYTDTERMGAGYAHRMGQIEPTIQALEKTGRPGFITNLMGYDGIGGKLRPYAESEAQQKYRAAQEDWVRAKLRRESGAAIPETEMEREIRTYFVQPGETADVAAQKQVARAAAMEQMRIGAGRAADQIGTPPAPPGAVLGGQEVDFNSLK